MFTKHTIAIGAAVNGPSDIKAGDIDKDGDVDLVWVVREGGSTYDGVYWAENDGSQNFTATLIPVATGKARHVELTDMNNDGEMDIVCAVLTNNEVYWLKNDGSENFTKVRMSISGSFPINFELRDLDADGDLDVVLASFNSNNISWIENLGNENYATNVICSSIAGPTCVAVADMDNDGYLDVVSCAQTESNIYLHQMDSMIVRGGFSASDASLKVVGFLEFESDIQFDLTKPLVSGTHFTPSSTPYGSTPVLDSVSFTNSPARYTYSLSYSGSVFSFANDFNFSLYNVGLSSPEDDNSGSYNSTGNKIQINTAKNIIYTEDKNSGNINYVDGVWTNGSGTANAPNNSDVAAKMVIIEGNVTLTEAAMVNELDVRQGATITIDPGVCLNVANTAENSGTIILDADANGFSQYIGPPVRGTVRQVINSAGWHYIGSPFSDTKWSDVSINSGGILNHNSGAATNTGVTSGCGSCNVWWYDPSNFNGTDISNNGSLAFGSWTTSGTADDDFINSGKGWSIYLDNNNFGTAPWTLELTGTMGGGDVQQTTNTNNGGWNLINNPYPSYLNWDAFSDLTNTQKINSAYYLYDPATGNYVTYGDGTGVNGATANIAPFQSFFVQTTIIGGQNAGNVSQPFPVSRTQQSSNCQTTGNTFFKAQANERSLVRLKTTVLSSQKTDETVLRFEDDFINVYSPKEDVNKFFSAYTDIASIYSVNGSQKLVINSLQNPEGKRESCRLGVVSAHQNSVSIALTEVPKGWNVYLEDLAHPYQDWHNLETAYSFVHDENFEERFVLHYNVIKEKMDLSHSLFQNVAGSYSIYYNSADELIIDKYNNSPLIWELYSLSGQKLSNGSTEDQQTVITTPNLASGVYLLRVNDGLKIQQEKVLIK